MRLSIIVAAAENNVIGDSCAPKHNIPWDIPADLRHFREITKGKPIVMGRKTMETIGRLLPGRTNIVITREDRVPFDGAMRAGSVAALAKTAERACSQAWGRYVYEHPELYGMVDGLRFFNAHNDLFQEVAKYRAARRMWAEIMRDRFGATDERSLKLRFHTQTAGSSLTAQQAENNIVRTAVQALSAVLGGTQSLHTNAFDEALALPTERSARIALRTQQILASEGGLTGTADPLAGSYYVESLTDAVEEEAWEYIRRIDDMGGSVKAIEERFMQREIEEAAFRYQREVEKEERVIVGVNRYSSEEDPDMDLHTADEAIQERQAERLQELRESRDSSAVESALTDLQHAAEGSDNLLYPMKEALANLATLGEVSDILRKIFGEYRPS